MSAQVSTALAIADPSIPKAVSEDVLRSDDRSWGADVNEATHDWGKNISADLRKLKVAAMRLKDVGLVWARGATELFEVYHWRPHSRTTPYAALGLWLIWNPTWVFTTLFAGLFLALALKFPSRRKRHLDAIGVDCELSKGSFVPLEDPKRDPDAPVRGPATAPAARDDDDDRDDDGAADDADADDAGNNLVRQLETQYHDFVDMIMYLPASRVRRRRGRESLRRTGTRSTSSPRSRPSSSRASPSSPGATSASPASSPSSSSSASSSPAPSSPAPSSTSASSPSPTSSPCTRPSSRGPSPSTTTPAASRT